MKLDDLNNLSIPELESYYQTLGVIRKYIHERITALHYQSANIAALAKDCFERATKMVPQLPQEW